MVIVRVLVFAMITELGSGAGPLKVTIGSLPDEVLLVNIHILCERLHTKKGGLLWCARV